MTVSTFSTIKSKLPLNANKAVGVQDIHDVVDTAQNVINGISAPTIITGSVNLATWPGVTTGALADNAARIANGTAIQEALDNAHTNKKYVEAPGGAYHYNASRVSSFTSGSAYNINVGLQVRHEVAGLHGQFSYSGGTVFVQWAGDHPALTFGDADGRVSAVGTEYKGFMAGHGAGVTMGTNSRGLLIGAMFQCQFDQIRYDKFCGGGNTKPYIGWDHVQTPGAWFFSNRVGTLFVDAGQQNIFRMKVNSTGNTFDNVYIGRDEGGGPPLVNGSVFDVEDGQQGTFRQLNIEWTDSSNLLSVVNTRGLLIDSLHIEGCDMMGANPSVFYNEISTVNLRSVQLFDVAFESAKLTGTPSIFSSWGSGQTHVENLDARFHVNPATTYGYANTRFRVHNPATDAGQKPNVKIKHLYVQGHTAGLDLDTTLPGGTFGEVYQLSDYDWDRSRSRTQNASLLVASNASIIMYGAHQHSQAVFNTAITADRKAILSNKLAPSGFGSTINCAVGDTREVSRLKECTGSFNVYVMDSADTTVLATLSVSASDQTIRLIFNGTTWVLA